MKRIIGNGMIAVLLMMAGMMVGCGGNTSNNGQPSIEYRIVADASQEIGGDELWAMVDGELVNTEIEAEDFLEIIDQRDYDGDGLQEAFVFQSTGGSGHLPEMIVYYDRETKTFKKVEFINVSVYLNDTVEEWNGKWSFIGGNDDHYERFVYEKGRIMKVEDYTKPLPDGAENLLVINPYTMFSEEEREACYECEVKKRVSYDLDSDGKNEIIECILEPGVNWGDPELNYKPTLDITIQWSKGYMMHLTDNEDDPWIEFIVLSTKTNGVYDLTNGLRGATYRWDGQRYING